MDRIDKINRLYRTNRVNRIFENRYSRGRLSGLPTGQYIILNVVTRRDMAGGSGGC
jgi:hypothetical protein